MAGLDAYVPDFTAVIVEFGVAATLERTVAIVDASTQAKTGETVTTYAVTATPPNPFKRSFLGPGDAYAGGSAPSESLETIVAAEGLAVAPKEGDRLILAGSTYVVDTVTTFQTGELIAAYQLAVSKA